MLQAGEQRTVAGVVAEVSGSQQMTFLGMGYLAQEVEVEMVWEAVAVVDGLAYTCRNR